ncbi:MAG: ATP-binding protein [Cryomorphaceae bacterium]
MGKKVAILWLCLVGALIHVGAWAQSVSNSSLFIQRLAEAKSVIAYPDSSLGILQELNVHDLSDSLLAEYFKAKGSAFFYKGMMDSAIANFSGAMASLDSTTCNDQFTLVSNGLAVAMHAAGLKMQAIEYYTLSLGCAEFRDDQKMKLKIYNNLSILNRELGIYDRAQLFLDKAFKLTDPSEPHAMASLYNSRGQNFLLVEQVDSALHYFELSYANRHPDDLKGKGIGLNNLGYAHSLQGNVEKAMEYYSEAAIIREKIEDLYGSASIFINMANLAMEQGDLSQANALIQNAILLNQNIRSPDIETRLLASRSVLEEKRGNTALALDLLRQYQHMSDSTMAEDLIKEASASQYQIAIVEAENKVKRIQSKETEREATIIRQRIINLSLAIAIAVFVGLFALLLYQLKLLSDLRKTLTEKRDEAERKAQLRRETLNAVVHELRTPMNAIVSLADLINREEDVEELRSMTDLLQRSSKRLLGITNNVLTFSRLEEGSVEPVLRPENLSRLVDDIVKLLSPQATVKGLTFSTDIEPDVKILTDRSMMEIVLMNLVGNALKYTKVGGVHVSLALKQGDVHIVIEDTGIGISEADQKKVFEPFFQSTSSSDSSIEGSGLGLSITKHYIEQMKGRIWLESVEKEGSVFTIVFSALD